MAWYNLNFWDDINLIVAWYLRLIFLSLNWVYFCLITTIINFLFISTRAAFSFRLKTTFCSFLLKRLQGNLFSYRIKKTIFLDCNINFQSKLDDNYQFVIEILWITLHNNLMLTLSVLSTRLQICRHNFI